MGSNSLGMRWSDDARMTGNMGVVDDVKCRQEDGQCEVSRNLNWQSSCKILEHELYQGSVVEAVAFCGRQDDAMSADSSGRLADRDTGHRSGSETIGSARHRAGMSKLPRIVLSTY